jgi:hypothetical protein
VFDIFLSYAHADIARVSPLVAALRDRGLNVWFDEKDVDVFGGITDAVATGIAESKALVAFYSVVYPERRACQWEMTRAFLSAQRRADPRSRVLVINPEPDAAHIFPIELRDARFQRAPGPDPADTTRVIDGISQHVSGLDGMLGEFVSSEPRWYPPGSALGSVRFVGRLNEMWRIHSALHAADAGLITNVSGLSVAQIRGLGGVGKTLLAQEYARRFGAAHPGGVMWVPVYGADKDTARQNYLAQLHRLAGALELTLERTELDAVLSSIATELERRGQKCLWILDDIPEQLTLEELRELLPPHPIARTLFTTRSRAFDALAPAIDLDVLPPDDAVRLLTARRQPQDAEERRAARNIAESLGGHALALDIAGSAMHKRQGLRTFAQFLAALDEPDHDELEVIAELADALPSSREKSIVRVLLRSIAMLDDLGNDFLDLAATLERAPIAADLVAATFERAKGVDSRTAADLAARALDAAALLSLASRVESPAGCWQVHVLVARVQRLKRRRDASSRIRLSAINALVDVLDHASLRPPQAIDVHNVAHALHLSRSADDSEALPLLGALGRYQASRGDYAMARRTLGRQWETSRKLLGPDDAATLAAETGLADALHHGHYRANDRSDAEQHHRHALEVRLQALGSKHPDTLSSMERLAEITLDDGRISDAAMYLNHIVPVRDEVLGHEHPDTLRAARLAALRWLRMGERRGLVALSEILRVQESALGRDHLETLTTLAIGAKLIQKSDPTSATSWFERVLAGRRLALGPDHPLTIEAAEALASHLLFNRSSEEGAVGRALDIQREVDAAERRRQFGADNPKASEIERANDRVQALLAENETFEAKELIDKLVQTSRQLLGDDDPVTLRVLTTFGDALLAMGYSDGAHDTYQMVLDARRRILGEHDPETESSRRKLAELGEG